VRQRKYLIDTGHPFECKIFLGGGVFDQEDVGKPPCEEKWGLGEPISAVACMTITGMVYYCVVLLLTQTVIEGSDGSLV